MEIDSETTEHFITSVERHRILLYDRTDKCCHDEDRKNNRLYVHSLAMEFDITDTQRNKNVRFYRAFVTSRIMGEDIKGI